MVIDNFSGRYAFLSNFYTHVDIEYENLRANCVEKIYQALKTNDPKRRNQIVKALTAGEAKRMGNDHLETVLRDDWTDDNKVIIMGEIISVKFAIPDLRRKLLLTGDRELVEGNRWKDDFWGVYKGKGLNWLGIILMNERTSIREKRGL